MCVNKHGRGRVSPHFQALDSHHHHSSEISALFFFLIFMLYWSYSWFYVQVDGKVVHFYMRERERKRIVTQLFLTLCYPMDCNQPGSPVHRIRHFLRQGIFPTQGFNPGLLPCRQILNRGATSTVLQLYIYQHIHPFFIRFLSIIGYYRILSRFPCVLQ